MLNRLNLWKILERLLGTYRTLSTFTFQLPPQEQLGYGCRTGVPSAGKSIWTNTSALGIHGIIRDCGVDWLHVHPFLWALLGFVLQAEQLKWWNTTVGSKDSFSYRGTIAISYFYVNSSKRNSNCSKWHLPDTVSRLGWARRETLPGLSCRRHMTLCELCRSVNSLIWPGFSSHHCLSEQTVLCTETSVSSAWKEQQCRWSRAACTKLHKFTNLPQAHHEFTLLMWVKDSSLSCEAWMPWTGPKWRKEVHRNRRCNKLRNVQK